MGFEKLNAIKYQMQSRATIYLHLKDFDTKFIQNFIHRIRNYGIKVAYGEPNIHTVQKEALNGRFTFVVISDNLLKHETNI